MHTLSNLSDLLIAIEEEYRDEGLTIEEIEFQYFINEHIDE